MDLLNLKSLILDIINRRNLVCAVNQDAEEAFKKTVEVDRLIDMLKDASDQEVSIRVLKRQWKLIIDTELVMV